MQNEALEPSQWTGLAMGPKLRTWLGISEAEYRGEEAGERSASEALAFTDFVLAWVDQEPIDDEAMLIDILDELVSMDLPEAVLRLCDKGRALWSDSDFRGHLVVGIAAMLKGDLDLAEAHFVKAQALLPAEPAPYVNLVQIFLNQERLDEAMTWCLAGLDADRNNLRLWDLLALILREQYDEFFPEQLLAQAQSRHAWAGLALAADVSSTADKFFKLNLLQSTYDEGERDPNFLVEYTAALGIASEFDKIPAIVWQAEKATSNQLPWQLYVHAAQAQLGLGRVQEAMAQLAKAKRQPNLDAQAEQALAEVAAMIAEAEQEATQSHVH